MKIFWLWIASIMFFAQMLSAQTSVTDGVLINADSMYRDVNKRIVRLEGNVQLVFQGQHLSCERAELDLQRQEITATGKVILSNERVHVEGDKVVFNYKQNTGQIYNGFVQSGQVVFEGDMIEKVAESRYIANNAEYTACETCPPGWSFSGRKIDAEIGGYARIKRPVFKVAGVPVLILPGIIVPLKSARQSGFLVPSMDYSKKGGLALAESYFWAIDRSQDLTFTGQWYKERGLKAHADYRYVLAEQSKGRLQTAWLRDETLSSEYAKYNLSKDFDRYFLWYNHHHQLPNEYVHRMDIKAVSDLRYPRDFPDELKGHGDPALENRASISKSNDDHYLSGEVDVYTNLLKTHPLASNQDAVHRFPELRYSLKEHQIGGEWGPYLGLDMNYVNFVREKFNYDDLAVSNGSLRPLPLGEREDLQRDGKFDYYPNRRPEDGENADIFRTGQRLDIRPSVSYPFQVARIFEVVPTVSYRETQYRFYPTDAAEHPEPVAGDAERRGFSATAARRYVQTDLRTKTEFSRVFGSPDPEGNRWKHAVEPEIGYSLIPWIRRPDHPFFGEFDGQQYTRQFDPISDADLMNPNTKLQFDYQDRTYERQVVDFAITNRITRKIWHNSGPDYKTVALFRLSQAYDFNEAKSPTPHPWSPINSLLDLRFERFETYTTAAYNPYAKITNVSSRVRLMTSPKNFAQVSYTRNFIVDDEYNVVPNGETRNFGLGLGIRVSFLEAVGQVDYNAINWQIQSWNYTLNIRPPGDCWVIKLEHRQVVNGDPQIRGSLAFDFGGENVEKKSL